MQIVSLSIVAYKSRRKNARCEEKHFGIYPDADKLIKRFTSNQMAELQSWMKYMDEHGYPLFGFTLMDGTDIDASGDSRFIMMHDTSGERLGMEQCLSRAYNTMRLYNAALDGGYKAC